MPDRNSGRSSEELKKGACVQNCSESTCWRVQAMRSSRFHAPGGAQHTVRGRARVLEFFVFCSSEQTAHFTSAAPRRLHMLRVFLSRLNTSPDIVCWVP